MPGPRDGTLLSRRSRPPFFPPGCRGRGRSREGRSRPAWDPCHRKRPSEHLGRCLLPRKVCYAAGELVEVEPGLGANGRFQQGTDLPDLELQLAEQLCRPALGADHVPEDRALRPPGDEWRGQTVDVDERAASASAVLFYRDEGHDVVGPYVFSEPEGNDTVRYNLHLDRNSILRTLITSPPALRDPSARPDRQRLLDDAIRTLSSGGECVSERVACSPPKCSGSRLRYTSYLPPAKPSRRPACSDTLRKPLQWCGSSAACCSPSRARYRAATSR